MGKKLTGFLLKWVAGILLAWIGISAACVLVEALVRVPWGATRSLVFLGCFTLYFLIHFLFYKPVLSHVMAHELTHALAALLMGGKVTSIHASTTGGTTVVNRSHVFISLAPYVFPFYTTIALGLYAIAAPPLKVYFVGLTGFTYAFHLALTAFSLSHHQPDLKEGGKAFSLIFIFSGNMIVAMFLTAIVWPQTLGFSQSLSRTAHWAWFLLTGLFLWSRSLLSGPEVPAP